MRVVYQAVRREGSVSSCASLGWHILDVLAYSFIVMFICDVLL